MSDGVRGPLPGCPHCGNPAAGDLRPGWRHICAQGLAARQRAQDIATAGNWHLLTDEDAGRIEHEVEAIGGWEKLTSAQADEIFRGTGPIVDRARRCDGSSP